MLVRDLPMSCVGLGHGCCKPRDAWSYCDGSCVHFAVQWHWRVSVVFWDDCYTSRSVLLIAAPRCIELWPVDFLHSLLLWLTTFWILFPKKTRICCVLCSPLTSVTGKNSTSFHFGCINLIVSYSKVMKCSVQIFMHKYAVSAVWYGHTYSQFKLPIRVAQFNHWPRHLSLLLAYLHNFTVLPLQCMCKLFLTDILVIQP